MVLRKLQYSVLGTPRVRADSLHVNSPTPGDRSRVHSPTNPHPCPGRGGVGHTIDRCITLPTFEANDAAIELYKYTMHGSSKEKNWCPRGGRGLYDREYLPQMCSRKTQAMNSKLITSTGTGPLQNGTQTPIKYFWGS